MKRFAAVLAVALLSAGCVSIGRYNRDVKLLKQVVKIQGDIDEGLAKAMVAQKAYVDAMRARMADSQAESDASTQHSLRALDLRMDELENDTRAAVKRNPAFGKRVWRKRTKPVDYEVMKSTEFPKAEAK